MKMGRAKMCIVSICCCCWVVHWSKNSISTFVPLVLEASGGRAFPRTLASRHESITVLKKAAVAAAKAVQQSRRRTQLVVRAGCRRFWDDSAVAQLSGWAARCPHPCAVVADDWDNFPPRDGTWACVGDDAEPQYWRRRPLRLVLVVVVRVVIVQCVRVAAAAADHIRGDCPRRVDPRAKRIPRPRAGRGAVVGGLGLHPGTYHSHPTFSFMSRACLFTAFPTSRMLFCAQFKQSAIRELKAIMALKNVDSKGAQQVRLLAQLPAFYTWSYSPQFSCVAVVLGAVPARIPHGL